MKKISLLFVFLYLTVSFSSFTFSQIFTENFNYNPNDSLRAHSWKVISNKGTRPISVGTSNGLTYTGYASSGNAAILNGSTTAGQSLFYSFAKDSVGSVYISFLIKATNGSSLSFLALLPSTDSINTIARVFIKVGGYGGWNLGLSKGNEIAHSGPTTLAFDSTYLVVIKYTFNTGSANDQCTGYVFKTPKLPATEPGTAEIATFSTATITDASSIGRVWLSSLPSVTPQGTVAGPNLVIDGIRVGTTWNDAPMPVELSSFVSNVSERTIQLNWITQTEKNSNKFDIERKTIDADWALIGSVKASVLSNSPKQYSYTDKNLQSGKYQYRLKMIDNDGTFEYSKTIETEIAIPKNFELSQNYPNPFNPNTVISYSLPLASDVRIIVYNSLGQTVKVLENGFKNAGSYSVNLNANELSSGAYFYKIEAGQFSQIKKMLLLK